MPFLTDLTKSPSHCITTNVGYSPEGTTYFFTRIAGTGVPRENGKTIITTMVKIDGAVLPQAIAIVSALFSWLIPQGGGLPFY